jgi:hypothetical protein
MDSGQPREMPYRPRHKLGSASEPAAEHVAQSVLPCELAESRAFGVVQPPSAGYLLLAVAPRSACSPFVLTRLWCGEGRLSRWCCCVCLVMPARRGELGPQRSWTKNLAQEMQVQVQVQMQMQCQREPPTPLVPFSSPCPLRKGTQEPEPGGHGSNFLSHSLSPTRTWMSLPGP